MCQISLRRCVKVSLAKLFSPTLNSYSKPRSTIQVSMMRSPQIWIRLKDIQAMKRKVIVLMVLSSKSDDFPLLILRGSLCASSYCQPQHSHRPQGHNCNQAQPSHHHLTFPFAFWEWATEYHPLQVLEAIFKFTAI